MTNFIAESQLTTQWAAIAPYFTITNESEYDLAIERLNQLLDLVGDDELHPLYGFLDTLGILIEAYEREHFQLEPSSPREILSLMMEQHHLSQSDLPEIGSQGVVSEILHGKRDLNLRQIKALAQRFNLSLSTFII